MFAKVKVMKREAIEMFKGEIIKGKVNIYATDNSKILSMYNENIEKVVKEIVEIFKYADSIIYVSDKATLKMSFIMTSEEIYETLILQEAEDLMKHSKTYDEQDSRTHLFDKVDSCVRFIRDNNDYIKEILITHQEDFLFEKDFEIKIFDVTKYDYHIEVMGNIYNIIYEEEEWNEIWTKILKRVGV